MKCAEKEIGAAGNFLYDYYCLKDAARRNFDIVYEAGYATCSPFFYLLKGRKTKLITNMDGIEWMRSKWGFFTKRLMKYLESLAVKRSHYILSDNPGIQQYYKNSFRKDSFMIPYGADLAVNPDKNDLKCFNVSAGNYFMLIARMEPENNIELILNSYKQCNRTEPFLVIGNYETKYGRFLYEQYNNERTRFLGSIYDKKILDSLRFFCKAYLHGHSVGGTNPSLLEAMASSAFIIAHNNSFNASVLKSNALYFETTETLTQLYNNIDAELFLHKTAFINNNVNEINTNYSWQYIIDQYEEIFEKIILEKRV
jgi:glycosyltransferase involved in cell wall biosynthesis